MKKKVGRPPQPGVTHRKIYEMDGQRKTLTEWAREYSITRNVVADRLALGIPLREALTRPVDDRFSNGSIRKFGRMWKVCAKCEWSEQVDHHPACCYIDHPQHGRRPVSAEDCTSKKPGSVFKPRKSGRWTPAQQMVFGEREAR